MQLESIKFELYITKILSGLIFKDPDLFWDIKKKRKLIKYA